ncbi:MAG TPA: SAM-dependent chlorinase/fluorinase [Pyrinomonadaceae bacterium]
MKARRVGQMQPGRKGRESPNLPVLTLLTDFGTADYFTGAVKGAILSVNPLGVIADITHEIPPHDIEAGAFTLLAGYATFPPGTIHMAVVDPGVGSARRPIIVQAGDYFFVGPDNGLFTYIYDREPSHEVFHVTAEKYFRSSPSTTFHGRDIFAPVAAWLSKGIKPSAFGPSITDAVRLQTSLNPVVRRDGKIEARIIHIDRFGNCITNLTRDLFDDKRSPTLLTKRKRINILLDSYSSAPPNTPFAIWGSAGFLEISLNAHSAAQKLTLKRGDSIVVDDN